MTKKRRAAVPQALYLEAPVGVAQWLVLVGGHRVFVSRRGNRGFAFCWGCAHWACPHIEPAVLRAYGQGGEGE